MRPGNGPRGWPPRIDNVSPKHTCTRFVRHAMYTGRGRGRVFLIRRRGTGGYFFVVVFTRNALPTPVAHPPSKLNPYGNGYARKPNACTPGPRFEPWATDDDYCVSRLWTFCVMLFTTVRIHRRSGVCKSFAVDRIERNNWRIKGSRRTVSWRLVCLTLHFWGGNVVGFPIAYRITYDFIGSGRRRLNIDNHWRPTF